MSDAKYEPDPFPSYRPPREPTVLDQVARQFKENESVAKEIERRVRSLTPSEEVGSREP